MRSIPKILLMIESSRESGRKLTAGIADYAHHFGPWQFQWEPVGLQGISQKLSEGAFDGMLVRDVANLGGGEADVPCVVFSYGRKRNPGQVYVTTDDAAIASTIATDFVRRGFRNFAFVGLRDAPWALNRGRHFEAALQSQGMKTELFFADAPEVTNRKGQASDRALTQWLRELPKPVALMACNDDMALRLLHLCVAAGIRVPEDCAVVGVDNDPVVCGLSDPPLSSVSIDHHQAGYLAASALARMMQGEAPERTVITAAVGDLVMRQSSDLIAVDDPAVSKAIRFIQQHVDRKVFVDEVARAAGLNRRTLERRFQGHFDQGIQTRCREMRCDHVEQLLSERHLSLEQIAFQCGFSAAGHLTRFYSSIRSESPSSYRKRMAAR
jgi:LacI family transcriptional regulator